MGLFSYFQGYNFMFVGSLFSVFLDWFHSYNCSMLFGVLIFVFLMMYFLLMNSYYYKSCKVEYQAVEFLFTVMPIIILLFQIMPSLSLLYYYGTMCMDVALSIKVIGHQWYWSYEYSDIPGLEFDSYMKSIDLLSLGELRLLEVDNRCVVPSNVSMRFCITSGDVIHSWALPSMGIKLDAMSGIISVINYVFPMIGLYYGQCSEICGANHSFMPIVLEVTLLDNFKAWCMNYIS